MAFLNEPNPHRNRIIRTLVFGSGRGMAFKQFGHYRLSTVSDGGNQRGLVED